MKLEQFVKDLKDLPDSELMERIAEIRRRRVAAPEKAKAAGKKASKSKEEKLLELLKSLSPEMQKSLLQEAKDA